MHLRSVILSLLVLASLAACSSTGRLGEFQFNQKRVVFRSIAETPAMSASVHVNDPAPGATPWTAVASVLLSIAGSAAADEGVQNTVNTSGVAALLSEGLESSMLERFHITPMSDGDGEADFIVETRLHNVELTADPGGVFLHLEASQVLFDWRDLSEIYDQDFDEHIALRFNGVGIDPAVASVIGVISAVQLLSMDEKEIQDAVLATAREAGHVFADDFVRAVAHSR